jgi:hypothetical protein
VDTVPAVDLAVLVRQIANTPGSALNRLLVTDAEGWGPHEENTARLLEIQAYQLDLDWAARIHDPDDPDTKARMTEAKRNRQKPPAKPIVPPIAIRPPAAAEAALQHYLDQIKRFAGPPEEPTPTLDDWEAAHGLTT